MTAPILRILLALTLARFAADLPGRDFILIAAFAELLRARSEKLYERRMRFWTALVALAGVGCAHGATVERLKDDSYRISCGEASLDQCLAKTAGNVCDRRAYFVERGISDVNRRGSSESPVIALSSQAIIRCGPDTGWGEQGEALMTKAPARAAAPSPPPRPASAAVPPKPAAICAPGSTQACVGVAGCTGGQACMADGSGYTPCDCGPAASPPPSPPAAAP